MLALVVQGNNKELLDVKTSALEAENKLALRWPGAIQCVRIAPVTTNIDTPCTHLSVYICVVANT